MAKLTASERKQLATLRLDLGALERQAQAEYGRLVRVHLPAALAPANLALQHYAAKLAEVRAFAAALAEEWRDDWDARSEAWQEGDAGQAADGFIGAWEELAECGTADFTPLQVLAPDAPVLEGHAVLLGVPEESD